MKNIAEIRPNRKSMCVLLCTVTQYYINRKASKWKTIVFRRIVRVSSRIFKITTNFMYLETRICKGIYQTPFLI